MKPTSQHHGLSFEGFHKDESPTFYGSKVEEYTQDCIDVTYKIFYSMGLNTSKKADLSTQQLKYVTQTW